MLPTPTISVLMPVYNAGKHLRPAMDSILGQSFDDFEFLCVDDGSTDDSPAILTEYACRDPRVNVITKSNGGVTSALNAGLKVARGEFIARMDADDIAIPDRFAAQLEHFREHPECVAVGCHVMMMDANGVDTERTNPITTHEEITASLWEGHGGALPHFGAMMRRAAVEKIRLYREQFRTAQDLDLFLRLSEVGRLGNVPRILMRYRVHEGSVGAARSQEQARNAREILRQAYERRGQKLPRRLKNWDNLVVTTNRLKWGWEAVKAGRFPDARTHAWGVLRRKPFRRYAWQLAFHAVLGSQRERARALYRAVRKMAGRGPHPPAPADTLNHKPG
ncbi:MAG: glycosyl transferase family 2 [Phycisphaerales bacterium]|jgi:glycosyltransferase involved in cell wall biosynthesis|nr:glycosyl transferase family 2 [Phycisphaerales bacterium]